MGLPRTNLVKSKSGSAPLPVLTSARDAVPSGSVEVHLEPAPAEVRPPNASIVDAGPSTQSLLERAAALGPMRATWESFVLPNDPVLAEKFQPRVAERRARFRRVVKVTLGACAAICFASLVASALGGGSEARASAEIGAAAATTTPVTTVEKLAVAQRAKMPRETPAPAHAPRRAAKRR